MGAWPVFQRLTFAVTATAAAVSLCCFGQDPAPGDPPEIGALRISQAEAPLLDGVLDESVWQRAPTAENFIQRDPQEGTPASEPTEVRILYTNTAIYFGIVCFDSHPELIRTTELGRDNSFNNDDSISILLDTFHDHRNAFLFRTNPLGAQYDALITDENSILNAQWDEKWRSEARINKIGWVVEIEIPLKSLRSSKAELQTWGLNFERIIRRKNEQTYWAGWSRDYQFRNVSQAGHLTHLQELRTGLRLRVKPFVLGGLSQLPGDSRSDFEDEFQVGIEDVKISLTPSVTADFTVNPDFAQTEVDEAQLNLTRFDLFFPEKREFFLEGAGIYDFGTERSRRPDLLVFFSRRIGLGVDESGEDDQDITIPILVGAKLTGDIGGFQFGALNMQTQQEGTIPASNYGVFRIKKKLLERSYVGGIFTNKMVSDDNHYNRVAGIDTNFVLFDKMTLRGFLTRSQTPDLKGKDLAYQGLLRWESDRFRVQLDRTRIDDNFNPEIGFVRRRDIIKHKARMSWRPRPGISSIRRFNFTTDHQWFTSQENFLESRRNVFFFFVNFESGDNTELRVARNYELLTEPFDIHPTVTIPAGGYDFTDYAFEVRTYAGRPVSGELEFNIGEFFDGRILSASFNLLVKFNKHLSVQVNHEYNSVSLPGGSFVAQLIKSRINYNFTSKLLTSAAIQHDNVSEEFLLNFRLNYIYRPGDDFFIVYNENRDFNNAFGGLINRTLLVKFNHSFDF